MRQGGLALFEEGFQFESSLNWIFGESIEGEVDVVVPLWSEGGQALFVQPGAVFWTGLAEEERIDGNFGAVYRTELFDSFIGGGSVFYDYDFQYGHSRLGAGVDLQSGLFQAGFNYYHPLDEWDEGRTDYEEQALRGVDFRIALEREVMRLGANLSYWRFEGEEDEKGDWKPSYGFDAGIRIVPGVFLEGGWEGHDETVSLDQRWNAGLAFRFSLPDFKGASYGEGGLSSNLWKFVEREKRILYEERLGIPRVNLSATQATPVVEPTAAGETETVTVEAELGKPLGEDIVLNITVVDETSTATLGTDFTYGHRVYELNETTGEQSAPGGDATACPTDPMMACEVMIPAGVTRFDIEANIAMNMEREVREFIDFQIEVPEEHADLLRGSVVERVTIEAHGNTVQFASAESTLSEDGDTPEGRVEVSVNVDLPSPVDIVLNITPTGSATEGTDYENLPDSLTIPAGQTSGTIMLRGIDNEEGDGNRLIELTLSGDLPDGWAFGSQTTHTVTLQDDDLSIFIADATPKSVAEPDNGTTQVTVMLGITRLPPTEITVVVEAAGAGNNGQTAAEGDDYTFTAVEVPFGGSSTDLTKTTTFAVRADDEPELDETIVLRLRDDHTNSRAGTGFSLGGPYTITIPANDNTVSFASDAPTTLDETNETPGIDVAINVNRPAPRDITLNIDTTSGTATAGTHFNISPATLTISAGEMSGTITLTGINNTDTGAPQIILTIPQSQSLPDGWTLGTATHTVDLVDDEVRTVSLNYSGPTSGVNAGGLGFLARMSIELSAPLEVDLMLNLVLGGTANSYLTFWSIDYNVLSAGTTQAPDVFGGGTRCQSSPCSILIEDGESFVDINFLFYGSPPSGTTAMVTVELPAGHPSDVEIGSSNSVTLTTQ